MPRVRVPRVRVQLRTWKDGTFARVGTEHVGPWLGWWISLGGAFSALGLLNTLLCAAARIVVSAAEIGVLPRALAELHEPTGAPRTLTLSSHERAHACIHAHAHARAHTRMHPYALALARALAPALLRPPSCARPLAPPTRACALARAGAATLALSAGLVFTLSLPFAQLVEFSMLFYGVTTALEFLALIRLRSTEPHTPRPYRVPCADGAALAAFCAPPLALCALLVVLAGRVSLAIFGGTIAAAWLAYCAREAPRSQRRPLLL
jgi:amino acid transporter